MKQLDEESFESTYFKYIVGAKFLLQPPKIFRIFHLKIMFAKWPHVLINGGEINSSIKSIFYYNYYVGLQEKYYAAIINMKKWW